MHPDDVRPPIGLGDPAIRTKGYADAEYRVYDRRGEIRWIWEERSWYATRPVRQ